MKVVLSRTDRIGDLILSTPAIATVRASFPGAHITMITSPHNRVVMERSTDIDELLEFPPGVSPRVFGRRFTGYDCAVALAPRTQDLQLVGATRARMRVGYTYVRRWIARLSAPLYVNRLMISAADPDLCDADPQRLVPHEAEQLLALVALAGATERRENLRLDIDDEDRAAVAQFAPAPIVFHLGMRWFTSGSTLASTLVLLEELRQLGIPIVLSCPAECAAYASAFEGAGHTVARDLPFHHWVALFERARCIVTVDTGATHVASAVRRPTLVAFEHRYFRLNSQEWAPYRVPSVLVRKPAAPEESALAEFRQHIVRGVADLIDA